MFNVMYLAVVYCQLARYEYELKVQREYRVLESYDTHNKKNKNVTNNKNVTTKMLHNKNVTNLFRSLILSHINLTLQRTMKNLLSRAGFERKYFVHLSWITLATNFSWLHSLIGRAAV